MASFLQEDNVCASGGEERVGCMYLTQVVQWSLQWTEGHWFDPWNLAQEYCSWLSQPWTQISSEEMTRKVQVIFTFLYSF